MPISLLVCYDIADDDRRASVSEMLEALGPRVQLSVFECRVTDRAALRSLIGELADIVDPIEDQVRVYTLGGRPHAPELIGARELEEGRDFLIL